MDLGARLRKLGRFVGGAPHADGAVELHVGDPRYDDWAVVRDFGDLETARAFRQLLSEHDVRSALTADWPLDEFGQGDVALRVPRGSETEAEELLDEP